jgi:NitT/TauT family transport system ATP-binding protein
MSAIAPEPAAAFSPVMQRSIETPHAALVGVTRVYQTQGRTLHALGPIDLNLAKGEFFSVVGPSGCGKSTLLDILAGLNPPQTGSAYFEGKPITGVPDGVGAVFQEDASFPWLSVRDNVAFGLRRAGVDPAEIKRRVDYAVGFMGLKDFASSYPAQLSGGMRQRVCIARTLVLQPRLIMLDEPFGALVITHALDEAAMLSDRVGVMSTRPGKFIDIVETGWGRDRDSRVVSTPHFGVISARLWEKLRVEALKMMSTGKS